MADSPEKQTWTCRCGKEIEYWILPLSDIVEHLEECDEATDILDEYDFDT